MVGKRENAERYVYLRLQISTSQSGRSNHMPIMP